MNQKDINWREICSPKGKYHIFQKDISLALGGIKDKNATQGGHPFDVVLVKLPPQAINFPKHSHSSQWELYLIQSGNGILFEEDAQKPLTAGDCVMLPPNIAHQIQNTSETEDMVFYVIANNADTDLVHYPDSDKWLIKPQRKIFKTNQDVDYYQDEE